MICVVGTRGDAGETRGDAGETRGRRGGDAGETRGRRDASRLYGPRKFQNIILQIGRFSVGVTLDRTDTMGDRNFILKIDFFDLLNRLQNRIWLSACSKFYFKATAKILFLTRQILQSNAGDSPQKQVNAANDPSLLHRLKNHRGGHRNKVTSPCSRTAPRCASSYCKYQI
jgi:hypothetical protein